MRSRTRFKKTRDDTSEARNGLVPGAAMEPERSSSVSAHSSRKSRLPLPSRSQWSCLTVLNLYSRCCLHLEPRIWCSADNVVYILESLAERCWTPRQLRLDNCPEFRSNELLVWPKAKGVKLAFSQPGKPKQNGFVESVKARAPKPGGSGWCCRGPAAGSGRFPGLPKPLPWCHRALAGGSG